MATPSDVLKMLSDEEVDIVDIRFCDLPGLMQHFSIPAHELTDDVFEEGLGFDGSSIRGFQEILAANRDPCRVLRYRSYASALQTVSVMRRVTTYGSMFALGRRSSM